MEIAKAAVAYRLGCWALGGWNTHRVTCIELDLGDQPILQLTSLNPAYASRQVVIDASGDAAIVGPRP